MKVVYLVNRYPKTSHSFVRREIRALEREGVEVVRVSVRHPDSELADPRDREEAERTIVLLQGGVPALIRALLVSLLRAPLRTLRAALRACALGWRSDRGLLRHAAYLAQAARLAQVARGADHVHAHFGTNPPLVALLAEVLGAPGFSFTVHGPEEFDRPLALKLREKIAAARFVVAISSYGRSQLYRWCAPEDAPKIEVVRCGVDELFLDARPTPVPDVPRLVCVGRLCPQKGQLLLVDAVARLAREGVAVELVLAGDGELRGALEQRARQEGVAERVRVTGWLAGERVREEIVSARALVLPSFAEGLPVVLMEALALGRPVLTTFVAGIPELVVPPGEPACGWIVPAGDIEALTRALREVLETPVERLEALARAGGERVRTLHDAAREASRLAVRFAEVSP